MSVLRSLALHVTRPSHKWGRLAVVLTPLAALGVWLKLVRIQHFYPDSGVVDVLTKVGSDVSFGIAWALFWVALCAWGPPLLRVVNFYLAHVFSLVVGVYLVFNHEFAMRTGKPLTWEPIMTAVRNPEGVSGMLESEINDRVTSLLWWVMMVTLIAPFVFGPLVAKAINRPSRRVRRAGAAAAAGLLVASLWSAPTVSAGFALAAPVQFAVAPVREATAYPNRLASQVTVPEREATTLQPGDQRQKRNLVVMTLESQRDVATLPQTRQPVTPVLDALAQRSIRPSRGYTVLPHTSKALTSIHCGFTPPLDAANSEADPGSLPGRCLPELLRDQGYKTAFFQSATESFERRRDTIRNLGFESFTPVEEMDTSGFLKSNYFGYQDEVMLAPQRNWLKKHAGSPFMLSMLTVAAHHDYNHHGRAQIDFSEDQDLNAYLNGLHYQDRFVGEVIDMFKQLGLYEQTVFVIVGDHGEGFGEHRIFQHDNTIYEEGIRIPLMVHDPQRPGKNAGTAANQLSIVPTVVDLLGFALTSDQAYHPSLVSGRSQAPVLTTCYARGLCTAVIDGDRKLIHHFGDRRDEVFDLSTDPAETNDLIEETDPAWVERHRDAALSWYMKVEQTYKAYREKQRQ